MSETEMERLEALVQAGNSESLAELLQLYRPHLLNFVKQQMSGQLQQKLDPEDVMQEISISCLRSVGDVDLSQRRPFDWVCQVARRRIIDAARKFQATDKRAVQREVPLSAGSDSDQPGFINMLVASITTPSKAFSRDQREFQLQEAIEQLPQESRDALRMRYVESMPTKEIAKRLNKSDGAIRVLLTRSLKKLQGLMPEQ